MESFRQYLTVEYRDHLHGGERGPGVKAMSPNLQWFRDYRPTTPQGRDFLDVGHLEGAGLAGMAADGWQVWGFDINPTATGPSRTVYPVFTASLFDRQFDAVMCREVIEHVDGWRMMLAELYRATKVGGVCQIQTPRPAGFDNRICYQHAHLQLFSPLALETEVKRAGFNVCDWWRWDIGQAWMLRR